MADPITDPRLAGERPLQFAREGRLVQGTWHDEEDGREIACLLGAAAGIDDATKCPASLMPLWAAHALPSLRKPPKTRYTPPPPPSAEGFMRTAEGECLAAGCHRCGGVNICPDEQGLKGGGGGCDRQSCVRKSR